MMLAKGDIFLACKRFSLGKKIYDHGKNAFQLCAHSAIWSICIYTLSYAFLIVVSEHILKNCCNLVPRPTSEIEDTKLIGDVQRRFIEATLWKYFSILHSNHFTNGNCEHLTLSYSSFCSSIVLSSPLLIYPWFIPSFSRSNQMLYNLTTAWEVMVAY